MSIKMPPSPTCTKTRVTDRYAILAKVFHWLSGSYDPIRIVQRTLNIIPPIPHSNLYFDPPGGSRSPA